MAMTKRRKPDALCEKETINEKPLLKNSEPIAMSEEEMERRMQSALADVYEVLGYASSERSAVEWSELELINDLVH